MFSHSALYLKIYFISLTPHPSFSFSFLETTTLHFKHTCFPRMFPSLNLSFISHFGALDWYIHMIQYVPFILSIRELQHIHCSTVGYYFVEQYSVNERKIVSKCQWLTVAITNRIAGWTKNTVVNFQIVFVLFYDILQHNRILIKETLQTVIRIIVLQNNIHKCQALIRTWWLIAWGWQWLWNYLKSLWNWAVDVITKLTPIPNIKSWKDFRFLLAKSFLC